MPLMLLVLHSQIEEVETVAAACHILYSITHDDAIRGIHFVDVETQLCKNNVASVKQCDDSVPAFNGTLSHTSEFISETSPLKSAVRALVMVLQWHAQRRDVTRACIRSITNLSRYSSVLKMMAKLGIADPVLTAATLHPHARDIIESVVKMMKSLAKETELKLSVPNSNTSPNPENAHIEVNERHQRLPFSVSVTGIPGLLLCLKSRPSDLELAAIVFCTLAALVGCGHKASTSLISTVPTVISPRSAEESKCISSSDTIPLSDFAQSQYPEVNSPGLNCIIYLKSSGTVGT